MGAWTPFLPFVVVVFVSAVGRLKYYKDSCPLKCRCEDYKESQTVHVSCSRANLTKIPTLPGNTALFDFYFKHNSIYNIQDSAFSYLPKLRTVKIISRVQWSFGKRPFKGLNNLLQLSLRSKLAMAQGLRHDIFTDLTFLRNISLHSIPIRVSEQNPMCSLVHLEELSLSKNGIQSLQFHQCFLTFKKLTTVKIYLNSIGRIGKNDFINLQQSKLTVLIISNCKIKAIEPMSFVAFKHLNTVSFIVNELRELPGNAFYGNFTDRFRLYLFHNLFRQLPCAFLKKARKLALLEMGQNNMSVPRMCPDITRDLKNITSLSLIDNNINSIDSSFFEPLGKLGIRIIKISARRIGNGSFATIKSLEHLEIHNYLSSEEVPSALLGLRETNIQFLRLYRTKTHELDESTFIGLRGSKLKHLILNHCRIELMARRTFATLIYVEVMDLSNNTIRILHDGVFAGLASLKELKLSSNNIIELYDLQKHSAVNPYLEKLWLDNNEIDFLNCNTFIGFKNLTHISLSRNSIRILSRCVFNSSKLNFLDLSYNKLRPFSHDDLSNVNNLQTLNLSFNSLEFVNESFNLFGNLKSLRYLSLDSFFFLNFYKYNPTLFCDLTKLIELRLASCQISRLQRSMFLNTSNLELLDLRDNIIAEIDPRAFKPLQKLTTLFLYRNKLSYVSQDYFKYLLSLKTLDLTQNPLVCDCSLIEFTSGACAHHIFLQGIATPRSFICSSPVKWAGQYFLDYDMSNPDCEDYTIMTLSVSLSVTIAVVLCLALLGRHYRYYMLYGIYYIRTKVRRLREVTDDNVYIYDAFIGYCSTDMKWIVEKLLPEIENERGYKLCLHHRDWLAGPSIVDNIIQSVENSRKVILVVSIEFAKSYWCQVETSLSQTRQMEGQKNSLILVLLEKVASRHMSGSLRHLLTSQTYLPWPADIKNRKLFWKRLASALKKPKRTAMHD